MRKLDVYLHNDLAGQLIQDQSGEIKFKYSEAYLEKKTAMPLSYSLPLQKEWFASRQCRGFFSGLLPEENNRKIIAHNLGISANNDFKMLEKIGGECAGAITFIPEGHLLKKNSHYQSLSDNELAEVLRQLPQRPLMAGNKDIRLSLAGAQNKIAVHIADHKISIPLGNTMSTHILKPAIANFEGLVFNEATCMKLSALVGLPTAKTSIGTVDGIDYLLVERYDRMTDKTGLTYRLHQEDFCQALAISSSMKYQNEGGPSLKKCFELIREIFSSPVMDLQHLLDVVIFNFLIGNHDAHGKNFSLLYECSENSYTTYTTRLAPSYDLLNTAYYPELSQKMAMRMGGEYHSWKISEKHFEKFAQETGLSVPIVKKRVLELCKTIISGLNKIDIDHPVSKKVAKIIQNNCEKTQILLENN